MEIEIFEVKDGDNVIGYGYRVGSVYQEYDPTKAGFAPMTRAIARKRASEVAERIAPIEVPTETENA